MRSLFVLVWSVLLMASLSSWGGTLAQFRTGFGEMDVELLETDKPATVANFMRYVDSGAYSNMFFHRWVTNFVIQGGGFFTTNRHTPMVQLAVIPPQPPIKNEYSVGRVYSNGYGTLAMARVPGDPNSASSQWFFNVRDNSGLDTVDGGFTVFGRVLRGTNVLNRFVAGNGIYQVNGGNVPVLYPSGAVTNNSALGELPVVDLRPLNPTYDDLIYADITLLKARGTRLAREREEISWVSVTNAVNRVEFTDRWPAVWNTLISTNGNGQIMSVVDTPPAQGGRYYRIRVDF